MIEQLKNTAVRVENEGQAHCVAALYKIAGFNECGAPKYDGHVSTDVNSYFIGGVGVAYDKLITLNQLAWDYGLLPKQAEHLVITDNGGIYWVAGYPENYKACSLISGKPTTEVKIKSGTIITTRPTERLVSTTAFDDQAKPVWPEKGSLPPVGVECEFSSDGHHNGYLWCIFRGLMSDGGYIVEYHHPTSPNRVTCTCFYPDVTKFRPIQTEKERLVELAFKKISAAGFEPESSDADYLYALYDAGMLKEPD